MTSYTLEVTFVSYNDTKKIKVPKAVKESAKDNGEDEAENSTDEMLEYMEDVDHVVYFQRPDTNFESH